MSHSLTDPGRYHALDVLRAVMMLLGLVLHAAVSYMTVANPAWLYHDPARSPLCDAIVVFIHAFRMPVFFVMAGFFAALLRERRGVRGFLRNRRSRILIPFLVAWIVLQPLVIYGFQYAQARGGYQIPEWITAIVPFEPYINCSTLHLWFLEYLCIYYVGAAILIRWTRGTTIPSRVDAIARRIFASPFRSLILAIPACLMLWFMHFGVLETSTFLLPRFNVLAAYALFFGAGWMLYRTRDLLPRIQHRVWLEIVVGLAAFGVHFGAVGAMLEARGETPELLAVAALSGGLMVWCFIFGITGLFLRYFDRPMPRMRYLTEASYWMYLVHLPIILWLAGWLAPYPWPAEAKVGVILLITIPVLLVSYQYFVRNTFLGEALNGKRFHSRPT